MVEEFYCDRKNVTPFIGWVGGWGGSNFIKKELSKKRVFFLIQTPTPCEGRHNTQYQIKRVFRKELSKKDYELLSSSVIDPKLRSIIIYDRPKNNLVLHFRF